MSGEERPRRRVTRGAVARPDAKVPNYNEEDDSDGQDVYIPSPSRKRPSASSLTDSPARGRPKKARNDIWTPEFLLTNPKSKLVNCELTDLVSQPLWDMLSLEDQAECMSHLPSLDVVATGDQMEMDGVPPTAKLVETFFEGNTFLQEDIRQFQDDLSEGRFEPSFLERAALAREKRLQGDFDRWKDDQFELWWGQKQKLAYGMLAGDTTRLRITDMARKGMLHEGDLWRYSRTFKGSVTIKKELICTAIDPTSFSLSFKCPPKKEEYVRADTDPLIIDSIENPTTLETKLLDIDGRVKKSERPNGNAFKSIRIFRGSEDIGSLFDVRMTAFDKLNGIEA